MAVDVVMRPPQARASGRRAGLSSGIRAVIDYDPGGVLPMRGRNRSRRSCTVEPFHAPLADECPASDQQRLHSAGQSATLPVVSDARWSAAFRNSWGAFVVWVAMLIDPAGGGVAAGAGALRAVPGSGLGRLPPADVLVASWMVWFGEHPDHQLPGDLGVGGGRRSRRGVCGARPLAGRGASGRDGYLAGSGRTGRSGGGTGLLGIFALFLIFV